MADYTYPSLLMGLANNNIDLTGKLKVLLVTSKYKPSAKHKTREDITHEAQGTGYTSGGSVLTEVAVKLVDESTVLTASPAIWEKATMTVRGAVVYYSSGGGAKYDGLICYCDFGSDMSSTNGAFTVNWSSDGILSLSPANEGS
jgi:hypothetical protein